MAPQRKMKWSGTKRLWTSILFLLLCVGALYPNRLWPLELVQAFLPYLACSGVVLLWFAGRDGHLSSAILYFIATAITLCSVSPYLPWKSTVQKGNADFKVGVFNIYHHNTHHKEALNTLLETQCDVLTVLEVSEVWDRVLTDGLTDIYPHAVRVPKSQCCYGMSVYSKQPFEADTVLHFTRDPVIRFTANIQGRETELWVVHTRPPIFPNDTDERNLLMAAVAKEIEKRERPAILMGDFNIVPWAQDFRKMAETAGLSDSRRGYLATYPMDIGIPLIPIDHILHSSEFSTALCETVTISGSDHKGLVAGLTLN